MFKKVLAFVFVSGAIAAVALTTTGSATAGEPAEWSLEECVDSAGKPTTKVTSGTKCELKNRKNGQCLIRVSHAGQADWDFSSCETKSKTMLFQKEGGGDIKCGDTVALQLGVGGNKQEWYRKCTNPQTVGINICSDEGAVQKKHFEWQLKSCANGQLESGKPFALYNTARKDSVVFAKRPSKMVDTCWADKIKYGQCSTVRDDD
jgi:hypothetical protein